VVVEVVEVMALAAVALVVIAQTQDLPPLLEPLIR
jgi:hypothetical protein